MPTRTALAPVAALRPAHRVVFVCAVLCLGARSEVGGQSRTLPWRVENTRVVGQDAALAIVASAALGRDGSVYVLEYTTSEVIRFDANGKVMWRAGRKGGGPGEFVRPYRVGVFPDGGAVVYDHATDITPLRSGELVLSGVVRDLTGAPPTALRSGVHVFGRDLASGRSS